MCGRMADIQSATAEIRRGRKKKKKKPQYENIMVCPIPYGDYKKTVRISAFWKQKVPVSHV